MPESNIGLGTAPCVALVFGAWPGQHAEGVTFARHFVPVDGSGFLGAHSGVPDGGDLVVGAALNALQIRKLRPEPPLFPEPSELRWLTSLDATAYDVVQGDLSTLRATGGDFSTATVQCLANDTAATAQDYGSPPAPGQAQWFLVRGVTATGNRTYNAPGSSQVGGRDFEIATSGASCP